MTRGLRHGRIIAPPEHARIDQAEYLKLLIALVAIIDIPGNIPIFIQQTVKFSALERLVTAVTAALATGVILIVFALFGETVLGTFGITIAAFKVLGGLVVLIIALDMLGLLRDDEEPEDAKSPKYGPVVTGIFPLSVPLFAGPGAITAVMVYAHEDYHSDHNLIVLFVILSACLALGAGLALASVLGRFIGPVTQVVMNRLLGMLVGALGVEFILEGLKAFFPALSAG